MADSSNLPVPVDSLSEIDSRKVDSVVALAKGVVGAVPVIGSMVAEAIGVFIPNQRIDRITRFLQVLEERVTGMEAKLHAKMGDEQFVDLLEDGLRQATRALSEERRGYIASLLKNSISNEDLSHIAGKRLLDILGQLSDPEIIILQSYGLPYLGDNTEFLEKHKAVLTATHVHRDSTKEEVQRAAVHSTFIPRLTSLGLLRPRFKKLGRDELPQFDEGTGMIKASDYDLTDLGKLLLQNLDFPIWPPL